MNHPSLPANSLIRRGMSILNIGEVKQGDGRVRRVWIANKNIEESFSIGERVMINYDKEACMITIDKSEVFANHTVSSRKGVEPIIDIKNKQVEEVFGDAQSIEVLFYESRIEIRVAKNEKAREARNKKGRKRIFELFAGAGTLTQFFKQEKFETVGALEMDGQFLTMFQNNNEDVYTIHAKIEDVRAEDYPDNVEVLLCGIPCTSFSVGNLKMKQAISAYKSGETHDKDKVKSYHESEALTFHVLNAIVAMNPKTVVVEEVEAYSQTASSMMLRTVLASMGYNISETVATGMHSKRKRWALVADMEKTVSLDGINETIDGKCINDFLETPIEDREWQNAFENKRVAGMIRKGLGIRSVSPYDITCGTFTTNGTRHTDPVLKHPTKELYSEFTNNEIAKIHGLVNYRLSGVKTIDRRILGQGVTDQFMLIAQRIVMAS